MRRRLTSFGTTILMLGSNSPFMSMIEATPIDATDCTALLTHPRRRTLLTHLNDGEQRTIETLVTQISETEETAGAEDDQYSTASAENREQIHVSLVHNHLPRLADNDCVEYDAVTGTVQLTDVGKSLVESTLFASIARSTPT